MRLNFDFKYSLIIAFIFFFAVCLFLPHDIFAETIIIDSELKSNSIAKNIDFFEDPDDTHTIASIKGDSVSWQNSGADSFNFGFTKSAYWFRFDAENTSGDAIDWYLEIGYPLIDSLILYYQDSSGAWREKVTGDSLPHSNRDMNTNNFVFNLRQEPGKARYYFKTKTDSSTNFPVTLWSPVEFFRVLMERLPVLWMYNGIMFIMLLYNLFIFFSARDLSYLFYVAFILSILLLQMTLNGQAFQYLWPESIWWANRASPFFTSMTCLMASLFFREYIHTRIEHKKTDKFILITITAPASIIALYSMLGEYRIAMISGTAAAMVTMLALMMLLVYHAATGSRPARFALTAFMGLIVGIAFYTLKTFGLIPNNFISIWGLQIGSALVVVLLSLGLADKINEMRKSMYGLNAELEKNRDEIKDRAVYLEDVVRSSNAISTSLLSLSNELEGISGKFSSLANEQASTSEEMSATFEELTSSNESIHKTTIKQKEEGVKGKEYAEFIKNSQEKINKAGVSVIQSIEVISESTNATEYTLSKMIDKMSVINDGGQSISNFAAMIDDITDRINLLSLNAAIEAARAGEYGRGFSVVSDEIGKLATATSDNSREISSEISKIIVDIQEGLNMFQNTKKSIDVTFTMVNEIKKNMTEVSNLMANQHKAISDGAVQAALIDTLSKEVEISTKEQSRSMLETMKSIERLSEMASEIAMLNAKIVEFNRLINEKAKTLDSMVSGLT